MFGVLVLKVGVTKLTLLGSKVLKVLRAVICVAQLELVVDPWAVLTTVRWTVLQNQRKDQKINIILQHCNLLDKI